MNAGRGKFKEYLTLLLIPLMIFDSYTDVTMIPVLTLLPGPIENLDVFQLHPDTSPQRHRFCGVVLVASLYRAISMCPSKQTDRHH